MIRCEVHEGPGDCIWIEGHPENVDVTANRWRRMPDQAPRRGGRVSRPNNR